MSGRRVLVVDDDPGILAGLDLLLKAEGLTTRGFTAWQAAAEAALAECDLALLDVYIGNQNGHDVLKRILALDPLLPVIMVSGQASPEEALRAVQAGAFDFVEKPFAPERLLLTAHNALRWRELNVTLLNTAVPVRASAAMRAVCAQAARMARSGAPVLVGGESGVGKDLVAGLVHVLSARSERPFVKLNCGAIARDLADSELFGHARGAFTGADREYAGRIAAAAGGTLFLDEVGELPAAVQVKLLRFLENGEIQRVGETSPRRVDVRVIAASNVDLAAAAAAGQFRQDLYFRLAVLQLAVPPLRERPADILPLVRHCLAQVAARDGRHLSQLEADAECALEAYAYPGNVRELKNLVERLACLGLATIDATAVAAALGTDPVPSAAVARPLANLLSRTLPLAEAKLELERAYLAAQFELHDRSVKATALALGLLPNNLSRRMKQLGIG
ncbi:MAG: hypothetical protein A2087_05260 [Spirochaetes bacterium GWD1_61_31]|nr:MAG: hypothetical protein A2Y37_10675 [Spirochaetes bacterium GWB1_60_80]OHD29796.1 MAG: hypothetical protein A2004_04950 [Spirochaetes bacterium GWC1_61_12]OHD42926.1 MAG: hypothetical protein A2Y35_13840 [Spirochaetes bacterium GWE1_60_18]OHD43487.1 MAG: hypothetical protein A2087_05260 [Spirochaetes bacterium GWD1_61_31]OHD59610.1 MAG: hypothetical protein A2Y32_12715 [Spirochaetes bacterium GWF1_60_12]